MMRNLVSTSPTLVSAIMGPDAYAHYGGFLATPRTGNNPQHAIDAGSVWAMDNDCFNHFDVGSILRMMARYEGLPRCMFAVAPDVVSNAQDTLIRFAWWQPLIRYYGYPVALAIQNGQQDYDIPWSAIDAVFIGGDTTFKYTDYVRGVVAEANRRGKWAHMGRVNSNRRLTYAKSIGCDSVDGSGYARFPEKSVPGAMPYLINRQLSLGD